MNPRKREAVVNALKRKGFEPSNTDHVRLQYFNTAGRKTRVWTKASHGGKHREISVSNLSKMAKQCKLSNHDFERLIDCPFVMGMRTCLLLQMKSLRLMITKIY